VRDPSAPARPAGPGAGRAAEPESAPLRWGVLGVADIAVRQVVPAMQKSPRARMEAIASRDLAKAQAAARSLAIPRAHGSYEALLADPGVEAVYVPLPNHLHVPWAIRAAEAGKHVLCEKPLGMNAAEVRGLLAARDRAGVVVAEAFMVRAHPQWLRVRELVRGGRIGELRLVHGHFSYNRRDPDDIRSRVEWGGGVLLDIGCYPVTLARWLYGAEPLEVAAVLDRDPELAVDRFVSALLRFPSGQAAITVAGQTAHFQRMQILGTAGRIEVEIPFNPPPDHSARILVDDGRDVSGAGVEVMRFDPVNQFTLQGERFWEAVRRGAAVPVTVEDALGNMAVLDALFRAAETGGWVAPRA